VLPNARLPIVVEAERTVLWGGDRDALHRRTPPCRRRIGLDPCGHDGGDLPCPCRTLRCTGNLATTRSTLHVQGFKLVPLCMHDQRADKAARPH